MLLIVMFDNSELSEEYIGQHYWPVCYIA